MVRIALQLSGRLRFTDDSMSSLYASLIEPIKPDVFCSFWNPENLDTVKRLRSILDPKLIELEDQSMIRPYIDDLFRFNVHANMPSMSYKFHRSSMLRQTYERQEGFRYDIVIQARSDNVFFERLDIDRCISCLDPLSILCVGFVYNPTIDDYVDGKRMVDNFYLGPRHLIDQANETFWRLKKQAKEWTDRNMLHEVRIPEIIQTKIWKDAGINIGDLIGSGPYGNFWYDIDRRETPWR